MYQACYPCGEKGQGARGSSPLADLWLGVHCPLDMLSTLVGDSAPPPPEWKGGKRKELATTSGAFVAVLTWKEILLAAWRYSPGTPMVITGLAQPPKDRARETGPPARNRDSQNFMGLPTSDGEAARARPGGHLYPVWVKGPGDVTPGEPFRSPQPQAGQIHLHRLIGGLRDNANPRPLLNHPSLCHWDHCMIRKLMVSEAGKRPFPGMWMARVG